jgi:hypothetical protein
MPAGWPIIVDVGAGQHFLAAPPARGDRGPDFPGGAQSGGKGM